MAVAVPPPPFLAVGIPYNDGAGRAVAADDFHSQQQFSPPSTSTTSSTSSSVTIVVIVIASAIIASASVYLLIRCITRRCNRSFRTSFSPADDVVSSNNNRTGEHDNHHHVICLEEDGGVEALPLFTFSSLTGNIAGGDCAVCLSKFEPDDQLRLLPLCCHAFHAQCIDAWLKSNQTCPLCRSTVNPTEADVLSKILSVDTRDGGNRSNSFRIEIGSISRRRGQSDSGRRSYSIGSFEYVLDDGYEVPVESLHQRGGSECLSVEKDSTAPEPPGQNLAAEIGDGGSGRRNNWLREYVDRVSVSLSSRTQSFRGSGRFFTGSSRRSEAVVPVDDFELHHSRAGEEISEIFRWLSGV